MPVAIVCQNIGIVNNLAFVIACVLYMSFHCFCTFVQWTNESLPTVNSALSAEQRAAHSAGAERVSGST